MNPEGNPESGAGGARLELVRAVSWTMLLLMSSCTALFLGPCMYDTRVNDSNLARLESEMAAIPAPEGATSLATHSAVGLLIGNGNHCDFFVGTLYKTKASAESVRAYYEGRMIYNPVTEQKESVSVGIMTNTSFSGLWIPMKLDRLEAWNVLPEEISDTNHTVYFLTLYRSYQKNSDWRCY